MNKLTIILKESGSVADLKKNFKIYQHSSQNVLINILVPKEIVEGKLHAQYFNEKGGIASESGVYTALKIGLSYTQDDGKLGKTESYYVRYLKDIKTADGEFLVYERIMPSVFTRVAGVGLSAPYMVINLVNILNNATVNVDEKVNKPVTLSLITSQKCVLEIEPSSELDVEQPTEPSELELLEGMVNDVLEKIDNKADINDAVLKFNVLEEKPSYAKYEKDGFKTLGIHFFNEKFNVPIEKDIIEERQGAVYVTGFRPHESEQNWIYQDEFFSFPGGIVTRTITLNATQSAIGQYAVISVGDWQIVNDQYIDEISNRIDTNTNNLNEALQKKAEELDSKIDSQVDRLDNKIDEGDSGLSSRITSEVKTLNSTITDQANRLDKKIESESLKLDQKIDKQSQHFTEVTDKNIQDIQKIQDFINSGSTDLGEYPSAKALPSDEQLNQYVKSVIEREPKEGDRLTFVLSKPNETDTIYLIKYSEATSSWTKTALPMLEKASNDNHGIIIGTDNETYKTEVQQGFRKAIVDIKGGEITDITHLNEAEGLESIFDHLNRNSNDIDSNTISINENKENLAAEVQRAGLAEKTNKEAIEAEVSRATQEETNLNNLITSEISRVETAAAEDLQTEITRVENEASEALNDEITRATGEEKRIDDYFKGEIERVEDGADSALQEEIKRATETEQGLQSSLDSEIERAKAAEVDNATNIENEIDRASNAEQNLEETKLNKNQINENYIKNLTFSLNGDTNVVSVAFKNPVSGEESSIEMTVIGAASEVLSGLMTAEMVKAFNQALHDIETVKYIGRQIKTFNTYAEAELFDWSTIEEIHINDYFIVQEDESRIVPAEQGHTTRYNCIDDNKPITIDSFRFHSIVNTIQIQLATETLLGGVLSTNAKGYVYVEPTGAMKLVGYDEILTSINNLITDLTNETQRATTAEEANASAIEGETARAQTAEKKNTDAIDSEISRAQAAEKELEDNKANRSELPKNLSDLNDDLNVITESTQKTKTSQLTNDGDGVQIQGQVDPFAKISQIPTKLSQLADDLKVITQSTQKTKTSQLTNDGDGTLNNAEVDPFAKVSQVPTKLSQMADDNTHRLTTDEEKKAWNDKLDSEDLADINKKLESITAEQLTQNSQIDRNKTDIVDINSEIESIKTEQLTQNTEIGKVDSKISSAISAVVNKAPAAFDTLKEIADWIEEDKTGTAALTQRVTNIETKNASQDTAITKAQTTADNAMPKAGGQFTGQISWNSTSLPANNEPEYFVTIEAFAEGGKTYYTTLSNAKKALGVTAVENKNTSQDTAISKAQSTADGAVTKNAQQDETISALSTMLGATQQDLNTKDAQNVKLTGNQSINGVKTFNNDIKGQSNLEIYNILKVLTRYGNAFEIKYDGNTGVEIGRRDGNSGQAYIDFHTDGNEKNDFNVRLIANNNGLDIKANDGLSLNGTKLEKWLQNWLENNSYHSVSWKTHDGNGGDHGLLYFTDRNRENDNLIIQWGAVYGKNPYVNLPTPIAQYYAVFTTQTEKEGVWDDNMKVYGRTNTGFKISGGGGEVWVQWLAIGKLPDGYSGMITDI